MSQSYFILTHFHGLLKLQPTLHLDYSFCKAHPYFLTDVSRYHIRISRLYINFSREDTCISKSIVKLNLNHHFEFKIIVIRFKNVSSDTLESYSEDPSCLCMLYLRDLIQHACFDMKERSEPKSRLEEMQSSIKLIPRLNISAHSQPFRYILIIGEILIATA
jgi:hypothetical protein